MKIPEHFRPPVIILSILSCFFCTIFMIATVARIIEAPYNEPHLYDAYRLYKFNPETILEEIGQEDKDLFSFSLDESTGTQYFSTDALPSGTFGWSQEDYLKVANAHNFQTQQETLDDWLLYSGAKFGITNCKNEITGFDYAWLHFYKEEGETYLTSTMLIFPLHEEIHSGGPIYEHYQYDDWIGMDVENLSLTAEDALTIAESAGGKYARQIASDNCRVSVRLRPKEISVTYWSYDENAQSFILFEVDVNQKTSKYKITVHLKE